MSNILSGLLTLGGIAVFMLILHVVMPWMERARFRAREHFRIERARKALRATREFQEYLMNRYHK